jgi:DNA polymerase III subunit alpha
MFAGHFHVHDEGSPLDGSGTRNQLTREAVKKGQTHLGCTNHGRLGTALEHIDACRHPEKYDDPDDPSRKRDKDERLTPILGIEAFWRPDRFMELPKGDRFGKNPHNWAQHLCVHARSLRGWHTLMRLSSKSWVRRERGGGFYGKPCFDWSMLEEDHEDIIISTACWSSPLSELILEGDEEGAREFCERMIGIVGADNFFFEIMPHDLDAQRQVNIEIVNLADSLGRPYFATGDVHMPYKDWADTQAVVRMAAYGQSVSKRERKKEAGEDTYTEEIDTVYLSSEDEMREMFFDHHPDLPEEVVQEALDNTVEFARRFRGYVIGKTTKLPKVTKRPEEAEEIIRKWADEGFDRLRQQWINDGLSKSEVTKRWAEYHERFEYEFDVLRRKRVLDYFILVGDMVRWAKSTAPIPRRTDSGKLIYIGAKKRPIRVGLGRGSAAGCLVSYLIGITAIDPIQHRLLFERFLNPDRVGLPDIDLDFQSDRRAEVKEYLAAKYGHDHVADIIAYQTFAPRAVINAVGATQDLNPAYLKEITETIGDTERGLEKIAKDNPVVAEFKKKQPEVWKHCTRLEDQLLRDSRHAGGVLITPKPITHYMPTQLGSDEESTVTAWSDRADFPIVSDYGFVKIDVLGVAGLEKQELAVKLIEEHFDIRIEPNDLPALRDPYATDQDVIDAFVRGMTLGVFQFSGRGITQLLRHIKPDNSIDLAVANALYRPGPIKIAFEYGDRKNGKIPERDWYWHDAVEPVLRETLGLIAFQEQVMEICKVLGNFTGGEADNMRKAISKLYRLPGDKAREFMETWREKWMQGCRDNGLDDLAATKIWEAILEFASYGFNRSHSASYALQAYQDMWLKVRYPLAFYAALLTVEKKNKAEDQIKFLRGVMREARVLDVDILPPDVNRSDRGWTIDGDKLRFGLVSIKDMGGKAVDDIKVVRHNRSFKSYEDFVARMPSSFSVTSNVALVKAGAFDSIDDRRRLLSRTRKEPEGRAHLKLAMSCGCKKTKLVKYADGDLESAIEETLESIQCKKHPDADVAEWKQDDPLHFVAQHIKQHGEAPDDAIEIDDDEIIALEEEVLNLPMSIGHTMANYHDFIAERIWTEEEFDALPPKPKKKGKQHGAFCNCDACEAAFCTVGGEVVNIKVITTKRSQEQMAFVDVAFGVNQWSLTFFPYIYKQCSRLLMKPTAFLFKGHKDDRGQMIVNDMADVIKVAEAEGWEPPPRDDSNVVSLDSRRKRKNKTKLKIKRKSA